MKNDAINIDKAITMLSIGEHTKMWKTLNLDFFF